jgi:uncharacterized protein YqgC (DUF456 family)
MSWMQILVVCGALLVGSAGVLLQLASLPGTWIVLFAAVAVRVVETFVPIGPVNGDPIFGWWTLGAMAALAITAEVVEFGASAVGARAGGASKRGMTGAVVGSLLGAIFGTFLIPIPVVGSLLGALLGAAVGAIVGELSVGGKTLTETAKPAAGAVAGRLMAVLAKSGFAAAMLLIMAIAAFL